MPVTRNDIAACAETCSITAAGCPHSTWITPDSSVATGRVLREKWCRDLCSFALRCPFFLYGALNNFLPYKIPGWVSRGVAREPVEVATTKLVAGMLSFPLFYSLQTWAVWRWFGSGPAIIYSVLLPLTGLAALFYVEATREFFGALRLWLLHWSKGDRMHRLHEMRDEIVRELELCRSEYLAFAERT